MLRRAEEVIGLEDEDQLPGNCVQELGDLREIHQSICSDPVQLEVQQQQQKQSRTFYNRILECSTTRDIHNKPSGSLVGRNAACSSKIL